MKLSNENKEVLFNILGINSKILDEYFNLSSNKNITTSEYEETLSRIKSYELEINNLLENMNMNIHLYKDTYSYITNIYPFLPPDLVEDLVYEDGISLVIKKTINMIRDHIINKISNGFSVSSDISLFNNTYDESFINMNEFYHIKRVILEDFYGILSSFIDIYSTKKENYDIKELLEYLKYKLSYLTSMPSLLIESEYLSSNIISNFNHVPTSAYKNIKEEFIYEIAIKLLECYNSFNDNDLKNSLAKIEIETFLAALSSCITLLEEETATSLLEYYEEIKEEEQELLEDNTSPTELVEDKLYSLFDNVLSLKSRYKVLYLK